jgi:hypothetical protein
VTRRLWFFTSVLLAIDPSGAGMRGGRVEGGNPPGGDDGRRRTVRGEKSGGIARIGQGRSRRMGPFSLLGGVKSEASYMGDRI